jgi:hypothetical protein
MATQNDLSVAELQNFNRPISLMVVSQAQTWTTRQRIQYEAMLKYLQAEFLSLADWAAQLRQYSQANTPQLGGPFSSVVALLTQNLELQKRLTELGDCGEVGNFLASIGSFDKVFVAQEDILTDTEALESRLGV